MTRTLKYIIYILVLLVILVGLFQMRSCEPGFWKDDREQISVHRIVVEKIEQIGRLELVRYRMKDVIEQKQEQPWYMVDTRVLLVVGGEAVGCIDLTKVKAEDISGEDTITIKLPAPELCYAKINHQDSKIYSVTGSPLIDSHPLVQEAFKRAEQQMMEAAKESGILEQTRANARLILQPLLEAVSGKAVKLEFEEK